MCASAISPGTPVPQRRKKRRPELDAPVEVEANGGQEADPLVENDVWMQARDAVLYKVRPREEEEAEEFVREINQ